VRALVLLVLAACGRVGFDDATRDASLDPTLVMHFTFDDAPGAAIANAAQPGRPGHCAMACPALVAGKYGNAYRFSGSGVAVPDGADLRLTTGTLALWVRVDELPGAGGFAFFAGKPYRNGDANSWEMFLSNSDVDGIQIAGGGDSVTNMYAGKIWNIPQGTWVHVAYTWTATDGRLYLDHVLANSDEGLLPVFDDHDLVIGIDLNANAYDHGLVGAIDDVRVYTRVLSPAEIATL
jgi:hypothetical protein